MESWALSLANTKCGFIPATPRRRLRPTRTRGRPSSSCPRVTITKPPSNLPFQPTVTTKPTSISERNSATTTGTLKIISGGQTGADRAALDFAIAHGLGHGGWCPRGRRAEDGPIPDRYRLRETAEADYAVRTRENVMDSDATLIFSVAKAIRG